MQEVEDAGPDVAGMLAVLRYRAAMIGWCVAASLAVALLLQIALPARYKSGVDILLDPTTSSGLHVAGGEFSSAPVDAAKIASVAAVIGSSNFLDEIVKAKHLTDDPEFVPPDGALSRWRRQIFGGSGYTAEQRFAVAVARLRKAVAVNRDGMTYVIRVEVASADPAKAKDLAQTIAETYIRNRLEARIISPAQVPESPSFPRAIVLLPIGLLLGLAAGLAAAFALERSANTLTTPDQIERLYRLPVLAAPPMLSPDDIVGGASRLDIVDHVAQRPFSEFSETIRSIRFALRHDPQRVRRIVQFASPMPAEGKSTLAACVALSLAMDGVRTILIDCDLRHSVTTDIFSAQNAHGVADVLMGLASFDDVLVPTSEHFLRVIPAGTVQSTPPDFADPQRLRALLQAAAAAADFVIVDTPAMEVTVDAAAVAQIVDATVLVTRWRYSDRTLLERAIERIQRAQGRVAGIVLNAVDMKTANRSGYWNKAYMRQTQKYYAAAEARSRAGQDARGAAL